MSSMFFFHSNFGWFGFVILTLQMVLATCLSPKPTYPQPIVCLALLTPLSHLHFFFSVFISGFEEVKRKLFFETTQ